MRSITLFLERAAEERDRDRKKSRRNLAGALILALFGFAFAMPGPEPPPQILRVPVPMPVLVAVPGPVMIAPARDGRADGDRDHRGVSGPEPLTFWHSLPPQVAEQTAVPDPQQHLCVAPHFALLKAGARQRVTVSNPGRDNVRITEITPQGASIDASDCEDRTLMAGERCLITLTASADATLTVTDHDGHVDTLQVQLSARP
jgi:hypothetical protein